VPHNIDRCLGLSSGPAQRKAALLATMDDDRDKRRRRAAFDEPHRINAALVAAHPQLLVDAQRQLHDAGVGLVNRRIAQRRDWCFALYRPAQIDELRNALRAALGG
jgi:hypothetical protein